MVNIWGDIHTPESKNKMIPFWVLWEKVLDLIHQILEERKLPRGPEPWKDFLQEYIKVPEEIVDIVLPFFALPSIPESPYLCRWYPRFSPEKLRAMMQSQKLSKVMYFMLMEKKAKGTISDTQFLELEACMDACM